jgi:hypothetical protein
MGEKIAHRKLSRNGPLDKHHYVDMLKQKNTTFRLMFYITNLKG